jgi:hypothetical protein
MFFSNKMPTKPIKSAPTLTLDCSNCKNTTEHELYWIVPGRYMKYMGKVVAGTKHYVYVCPICRYVGREITKEQALALKSGA